MTKIDQILEDWKPGVSLRKQNPLQVLDLFSGCGGMSLGFSAVGGATGAFSIIGGVDINKASLSTYHRNIGAPAICQDVRVLASDKGILKNFLKNLPNFDNRKPLVLIGCAPCQGFTSHRKKDWNNGPDERNSLVGAFAKIAGLLQPACVVMENVPELLTGRYRSHFEAFVTTLEAAGYKIKAKVENASAFGVPQKRLRAIIIAMRKPNFDLPTPILRSDQFRTVRNAIGNLPNVGVGIAHETDAMHKSAMHRMSTLAVIRAVPKNGGSRPRGVGPKCLDRVKGFSDVYGRLRWDQPAITITHYARNPASGRYVHPQQDRGLTMREAARLQGFPDSYQFIGGFDDVFRQIGEAVPPPLALALALEVRKNLLHMKAAELIETKLHASNKRKMQPASSIPLAYT